MRIQELRQLTPKKLLEELKKAQRGLAVSRFQVQTGKNQNFAELKKLRQLIARILTLLSQKPTDSNSENK